MLPFFSNAELMRAPRLIFRIAKLLQCAIHAFRLSSHADLPPMMDQLMRKRDPPVLRNNLHQIPLHLFGCGLLRQFQPARKPHHMGVNHYPHRNPIPRPQHHIPGLPCHARQRKNLFHRLRNLPAKLLRHHLCCTLDRLRLVAEKSGSPNQLLKLGQGSRSHRLRRRKRLEQCRGDQVHPHVRALRRQNRRNRKFPCILMIQRADYPWIRLRQNLQNCCYTLRRSGILRSTACFS